jgi:hypothetical protein
VIPIHLPDDREQSCRDASDETRRVEAIVVALIPEYHQVKVRDADGHLYALTRGTPGVDLPALRVGQRINCVVTRSLARVLSAVALD